MTFCLRWLLCGYYPIKVTPLRHMIKKITKSAVDKAKPSEKDWFIWDTELKGFGLKISKGGTKSYVFKYRYGSGRSAPSRRMTIGRHGSPWTPDQAREEALRIYARVISGDDPAYEKQEEKKQPTVSELCDDYLEHGCNQKKASTIATDRGRIERHIKPLLGLKKVRDVKRRDIKKFLNDVAKGKTATDIKTGHRGRAIVKGGKGTASRTLGLLGGIFSYAVDQELIERNPVRGVKRFKDKVNERYLSFEELIRLGEVLDASELNSMALDIIRLLVFTGARKGEIEKLSWDHVDFDKGLLRIPDGKTGRRIIRLNAGALDVLRSQNKVGKSPFVFPAVKGKKYYQGTSKVWPKIRILAEIKDVRIHDIRHSFASIAVSGGASLPMIGALLGHKDAKTTQRYAHLMDDVVRETNEKVGEKISRNL